MNPWLDDGDVQLYHGDARAVLRSLPAGVVQTCVTSPPYWGLRDYGTGAWSGGDPDCDHQLPKQPDRKFTNGRGEGQGDEYAGSNLRAWTTRDGSIYGAECGRCGARWVDSQLGLEPTPDEYVARLVSVFREVRRVLRDDGTLWLNLGDSYAGSWGNQGRKPERGTQRPINGEMLTPVHDGRYPSHKSNTGAVPDGLKPKDLVGVPWRVAFALQADGWVLRSAITWSKPNPMPESVTDRPTKSSEDVFLFAKAKWSGPEPGRYAHISDEDARWLALLFDTEGNIVIKRAQRDDRLQYGAQMAFANCSRRLLERAQEIVGAGSLHEREGKNAPVFYWQMTGQQARDLLHRIYPWLIVKQRQARVAIYMQDVVAEPKRRPGGYRTTEHGAFLERCWQTVKALNQFGDPDLSWVPEPAYGGWRECQRYFWDADAIREPSLRAGDIPGGTERGIGEFGVKPGWGNGVVPVARNCRSVWEIATQPTPEAHFATYPEELVRRCILAGTSERGECVECGAPWVRHVEMTKSWREDAETNPQAYGPGSGNRRIRSSNGGHSRSEYEQRGWRPSCNCQAWTWGQEPTRPQLVLDPFIGSGTTALVARRHGRRCIGIDLSEEYLEIAARRTQQLSLLT